MEVKHDCCMFELGHLCLRFIVFGTDEVKVDSFGMCWECNVLEDVGGLQNTVEQGFHSPD